MTFDLVAGWTGNLDFDLLADGEVPNGSMSGMSVELVIADANSGALYSIAGTVTVTDTTNWRVRYVPNAADIVEGVYRVRFKVTDGAGQVGYFPNGEPDVWVVRSAA